MICNASERLMHHNDELVSLKMKNTCKVLGYPIQDLLQNAGKIAPVTLFKHLEQHATA